MNATAGSRTAEALRASMDHPVIDADGHILEYTPLFIEYLRQVAGPDLQQRYLARSLAHDRYRWYETGPEGRQAQRLFRPPFFATPARNTLDRVTVTLPGLLRSRLDQLGIDFTILYPTMGLSLVNETDAEFRIALCRTYNTMVAEILAPHADRMTGVGIIPTFTPEEAIAELDYATGTLGLKAVMLGTLVRRPIPAAADLPAEMRRHATWVDVLALDSPYDYDPLWQRCIDRKVAVSAHVPSMGIGLRCSVSNYIYNQTGNFAAAAEAFCKAVVMGGVAKRFPKLNFAFLEGGAGWACDTFGGLDSRFKKRNRQSIQDLNPANLDLDFVRKAFAEYGGKAFQGKFELAGSETDIWPPIMLSHRHREDDRTVDEWVQSGITSRQDLREIFGKQFWFGCEADDPTAGWGFSGKGNPGGTPLQCFFSSDIGHWDVTDMAHVLSEAFELLDDGLLDDAQFRQFTFSHAARLHGGMNPDFFKGTVVADAVAGELDA